VACRRRESIVSGGGVLAQSGPSRSVIYRRRNDDVETGVWWMPSAACTGLSRLAPLGAGQLRQSGPVACCQIDSVKELSSKIWQLFRPGHHKRRE